MGKLPEYVGVSAFGIKMGVVVPGSDLVGMVYDSLEKCHADGLLNDGDTVCITESVVARAQKNFVTLEDIAIDLRRQLNINLDSSVGILFPILSRNRFSLILHALAAAVPEGRVVLQLSYPCDEVGNQLLPDEVAEELELKHNGVIMSEDLGERRFFHPITKVNYLELYQQIIQEQGCKAEVVLCNDPLQMLAYDLDGVIVANIHDRYKTVKKLKEKKANCVTLQDLCNDPMREAWSEWGLLGSNLSSGNKLKLAPRDGSKIAEQIQSRVYEGLGQKIEVIVYGDGAYRDPSTGIYELADPQPAFGITPGLSERYREGLKYKYLVDKMWDEGMEIAAIEEKMTERMGKVSERDDFESEGTTPRKVEDLIASLADLVSGSADAGTPLILVKNFLG